MLREHGVHAGNRAGTIAGTATLHQLWQITEHRGRVALVRGRLASGQTNLPLGVRNARKTVAQQQHILSLITKIFRHQVRHFSRLTPHDGCTVRGRQNHHGLAQTLRPKAFGNKFTRFSAALANKRQHHNISNGVAGHHTQQRALAHARTGYQAYSLTLGERQSTVNRAHAYIHWCRYWLAMQRRDAPTIEIGHKSRMYERLIVQRIAERVYYPAK